MTKILVQLFVKDYKNVENQRVRTAYGVLASIVGIVCNVILFTIKLIIGLFIGSISVLADALNNLSDAASAVISFAGVKLASRKADKEHPFGHGRYEYIAALVVAFLVFQVGFSCFKSSISKIFHPEEIKFQLSLIIILSLSVLVKVWLGFFNRTLGKRIDSAVMKATSADAFSDVIITTATILSIILSKVLHFNVDGYMGVVVSCFVLYAGFNIAKDTLEPLLGQAVSVETYDKISKKVESYDEIVGSHDLIVHSYGPTHTMATIHAEVPNNISFERAHEAIDRIERDVLRELGIFLVIHMDPIEIDNEHVKQVKNLIISIIEELDPQASLHDFRMVNGEKHMNVIFDLVVPHSYQEEQEEQLLLDIMQRVQKHDEKLQCIITIEHSYISKEMD